MPERETAVITGSTGGIGGAIADQLLTDGWGLILVNRKAQKAQDQKKSLTAVYPGAKITLIEAELIDIDQIKRAAQDILSRHPRIEALYNNSGLLTSKRVMSTQGHESNYAVNTLASYVMIQGLLPSLRRADGEPHTMIVNTTSSAQNAAKSLDVDTLSDPADIGGLTGAYATTKLALTTMGAAMADDLKKDGVMLRSVCPGAVLTPMTKTSDAMPGFLKLLVPLFFNKPEKQARKIVQAAKPTTFGGRTGIYVTNGKEKPLPALAADRNVQMRLMEKLSQDAV